LTHSAAAPSEIAIEQAHLDGLYALLDREREAVRGRMAAALRSETVDTRIALFERDAMVALHQERLTALDAVGDRLCFGRLDLRDGSRLYIGRIGLADDDHQPVLVDWRAPAAAAFYQATAAAPGPVVRRRHLTTRGRTVIAVEDEVLDLAALDAGERAHLVGEGALMAAVSAPRTGRMGDIVSTIQAEQDRIVRDDLRGVLVVQGGPGTGKTVVALHRTAYLLYTHRDKLARTGVLVIGPSAVFLRYIERVLPSLGETGVVMRSPGTLFPGVRTEREDATDAARIKGGLGMVSVMANAVRNRVAGPQAPLILDVEGRTITVAPDAVRAAVRSARDTGGLHNAARAEFVRRFYEHLVQRMAEPLAPGERLDAEARADIVEDLLASDDVRRAVDEAWPLLTAEDVLADLYARPEQLAAAAPALSAADRAALRRDPADARRWTTADVPLLDEAAELLGTDDTAARLVATQSAAQRREEVAYARESLRLTGGYAAALVTAEMLADRFRDAGPVRTVAERAGQDRKWAFGHVVVDEAQELSPMAWRMVMRRCPSRSMTLVGDIAQAGAAAGATDWADVLAPYAEDRWRLAELTINYRTPAAVMAMAAGMLRAAGVAARMPTSVREGEAPIAHRVGEDGLAALVQVVRAEHAALADRRMAVIAPREGAWAAEALAEALAGALPDGAVGHGAAAIDAAVAVFEPRQSKGLEVDVVVLVEPAEIVSGGARGASDLYVAMTRATQRLVIVHRLPLPAGMAGAVAADGVGLRA